MDVGRLVKTAADLLLILLITTLALQFFIEPEPRYYAPMQSPNRTVQIQAIPPAASGPAGGEAPERPVLNRTYDAPHHQMELSLFGRINEERTSRGADLLEWNEDIAAVAREHSENLAEQNDPLTDRNLLCYMPFVHHEGFDFGLYHDDRLENRSINYFASSGENIFLASAWTSRKTFDVDEANCTEMLTQPKGQEDVREELDRRLEYVKSIPRVKWLFTFATKDEIEQSIVDGWMDSSGHRNNILDPRFTESGIGVAQSNDFFIVTQVFIEAVDCGYLDGPCCEEEGFYPYCYLPLECMDRACK